MWLGRARALPIAMPHCQIGPTTKRQSEGLSDHGCPTQLSRIAIGTRLPIVAAGLGYSPTESNDVISAVRR